MKIFIDADACPVKEIVIEVGKQFEVPVCLVFSLSHYSQNHKVEIIIVDNIPEAVDIAISNKTKKGDIVITQDYGLASILLGKGCIVLHHTGRRYTKENIEELLFKRHISSKIRRGGGKTKGPRPFTEKDREFFKMALSKVLQNYRQE